MCTERQSNKLSGTCKKLVNASYNFIICVTTQLMMARRFSKMAAL